MKTHPTLRLSAVLLLLFLLGSTAARAQYLGLTPLEPAEEQAPPVTLSTAWSATAAHPGDQITLAIVLDIREPYHVNPRNPKDERLIPTNVELLDAPAPLRISTPVYPQPHPFEFGLEGAKKTIPVYSGQAIIYIPMAIAPSAQPGELTLNLQITWQACDDSLCLLPETVTRQVPLQIVPASTPTEPANEPLFTGYADAAAGATLPTLAIPFFGLDFEIDPTVLWLLLLVAAAGGFLLNLTPCVLPLIPIKIMGLSQAAGNRSRCFMLGAVMSVGVVAFWLAIGAAIAFISGFTAVNELFQQPFFTVGVGVVIALMALGMFGAFGVRLPGWVYLVNPSHETVHGSFLFGIMAAVLSTPCTAPFMGAAAAWAATQSPAIILATFAAIGVGMALPYLVLSAFPVLVNRMPRTGPASELIKQVMGLLMLAAAAFFIGTGLSGLLVSPPDPPTRAYWWAVALFIAIAGIWLAFRTFRITPAAHRRFAFSAIGVILLACSLFVGVSFTRDGPVDWVYYTPQRLQQAQQTDKVIVLEFTAEWCLNCKALEQAVLNNDRVAEMLNSPGVVPIKVDITGNNEPANRKLLEVGRRTIPLLIVYAPDGREIFKSDAYTTTQVLDALTRAHPTTAAAAN